MFITTEQFTGAPDGALMDKPSRALCANAADAGEGRGDGPEGRGDPGQTVNGSRRSRGPSPAPSSSSWLFLRPTPLKHTRTRALKVFSAQRKMATD